MKIKVLLVAPGMEVQKVRIPASTKFIKSFIGNDLIKLNITESVAIFANKNPNIEEFNRFYKDNIMMGSFFVVGLKKQKLASLKKLLDDGVITQADFDAAKAKLLGL